MPRHKKKIWRGAPAHSRFPCARWRQRRWLSWHSWHWKIGAAKLLNQYGKIERFPKTVLGEQKQQALLFKRLATLRTDAPLFDDVEELRWQGPTSTFAKFTRKIGEPRLLDRAIALADKLKQE
jgi:hypothetical protein